MKYKNIRNGIYRSQLEVTAAQELDSNNIPYEYEPWVVTLMPGMDHIVTSYEKCGKEFKLQKQKTRAITYKPDFVGKGWVMETKGVRTPDFRLKWKLFKQYIADNNLGLTLFMPGNKKEIIESVRLIKELCKTQVNLKSKKRSLRSQ